MNERLRLPMTPESLQATKLRRTILEVAEAFQNVCETCGGLPSGLPWQVYDRTIGECECDTPEKDTPE